ncbi:unnamed protein product, partial [Allacma fusca]
MNSLLQLWTSHNPVSYLLGGLHIKGRLKLGCSEKAREPVSRHSLFITVMTNTFLVVPIVKGILYIMARGSTGQNKKTTARKSTAKPPPPKRVAEEILDTLEEIKRSSDEDENENETTSQPLFSQSQSSQSSRFSPAVVSTPSQRSRDARARGRGKLATPEPESSDDETVESPAKRGRGRKKSVTPEPE